MELGLFTCGYQRYPLEQAFEDAGRFGYDYIELWGGYPHAYVEDLSLTGVREVERLVQKYHIPVIGTMEDSLYVHRNTMLIRLII